MKKIFYILMLSILSALALSSCTEDEVQPVETYSGGGNASADGKN